MNALGVGAALVAGFAGSAHCGVMCGGIATALAARSGAAGLGSAARSALGFNAGRLAGYALVGVALQILVQTLGGAVPGARFASVLRIVAAAWMVALAVRLLFERDIAWVARLGAWCWRRIAPLAAPAMRLPQPARNVALGMLWGFMPCGLVYSVLLVAASAPQAWDAAAIMLAFGLGTMPALLGIATGGAWGFGGLARRASLRRVAGVVVLGCGILTAWGGLGGMLGAGHLLGSPTCATPVNVP